MPAPTSRRPTGGRLHERLLRAVLAKLLPYPQRFRLALAAALAGKPFAPACRSGRAQAACRHAAARAGALSAPRHCAANLPGRRERKKAAWLCSPAASTTCWRRRSMPRRFGVLTRLGIEVVVAEGSGCCGSLVHHMGREEEALGQARANIDAWTALGPLDADRDHDLRLRHHREGLWLHAPHRFGLCANGPPKVAGSPRDISEYLATLPLETGASRARTCRRLSCRLLAAARATRHASAKGASRQAWLHSEGRSGRSFVLRLGRNLQYSAARHRKKVARAQSQDYRENCDLM